MGYVFPIVIHTIAFTNASLYVKLIKESEFEL